MKLTNEKLTKVLSKHKPQLSVDNNYTGLVLNSIGLSQVILDKNNILQNLHYLCLSNNNITNIDFIMHLQNLYYLDISNNPIDDFEPLNVKNIFGFLSLSVESFLEKKLLQIKGLNAGVVKIAIEDKHYLKSFLLLNTNIIELNDSIVYYKDILAIKENRKTTRFSTRIKLTFDDNKASNKANDATTQRNEIDKNSYTITNGNLIQLIKFFKTFSESLVKIIGHRASMKQLVHNETYIELERTKLVALSSIYHTLIKYSQDKKHKEQFYIAKTSYTHVTLNEHNTTTNTNAHVVINTGTSFNVFDYFELKRGPIKARLILLVSLLLFTVNALPKRFSAMLMKYILQKDFKIERVQDFTNFSLRTHMHLICVFFDLYDSFIGDVESSALVFDSSLIKALEMKKLILQSNVLYSHYMNNNNDKVKDKIACLKELNVIEETIVLAQYLMDYVTISNVEKELLMKDDDYVSEYCTFLEFKEKLLNEHLKMKNNNYNNECINEDDSSRRNSNVNGNTNARSINTLHIKNKYSSSNNNNSNQYKRFQIAQSLSDVKFSRNQLHCLKSKIHLRKEKIQNEHKNEMNHRNMNSVFSFLSINNPHNANKFPNISSLEFINNNNIQDANNAQQYKSIQYKRQNSHCDSLDNSYKMEDDIQINDLFTINKITVSKSKERIDSSYNNNNNNNTEHKRPRKKIKIIKAQSIDSTSSNNALPIIHSSRIYSGYPRLNANTNTNTNTNNTNHYVSVKEYLKSPTHNNNKKGLFAFYNPHLNTNSNRRVLTEGNIVDCSSCFSNNNNNNNGASISSHVMNCKQNSVLKLKLPEFNPLKWKDYSNSNVDGVVNNSENVINSYHGSRNNNNNNKLLFITPRKQSGYKHVSYFKNNSHFKMYDEFSSSLSHRYANKNNNNNNSSFGKEENTCIYSYETKQ